MARRRQAQKRVVVPDQRFNDIDIALFINHMMMDGKKDIARGILYAVCDDIAQKYRIDDPEVLRVFHKALSNVTPNVEVKSRRLGGATYQVPVEVGYDRAKKLAMRWILDAARKRAGRSMREKLLAELLDAEDRDGGGKGRGGAVKKKNDTHSMAEANKGLTLYRW